MDQAALRFVLAVVFVDSMSFGIVLPVFPRLIATLAHVDIADAAKYGGALAFTFALVQFVCAPIVGALGDRFGRRPVLLAALATFALDYVAMALVPNVSWLFVTRFIAGASGATYSTAAAAMADITAPEDRAKRFGAVGMAFGLGFIFGPLIGGLLGIVGTRAPFYGAAAIALGNLLFGLRSLRETLPIDRRRSFAWSRANPLGAVFALRRSPQVAGWLASLFAWQLAFFVMPSVWSYYGTLKFGWTPAVIGASLAVSGLLLALVQGRLIGIVVPKIGERRAALAGFASAVVAFVAIAFGSQTWAIFVALVPWAFAGFISPSLNALMSRALPPDEQGSLQGLVASSMSLASIVGPPLMTQLFAHYSATSARPYFPGAPFLASAALTVVAAFLATLAVRRSGATRESLAAPT